MSSTYRGWMYKVKVSFRSKKPYTFYLQTKGGEKSIKDLQIEIFT